MLVQVLQLPIGGGVDFLPLECFQEALAAGVVVRARFIVEPKAKRPYRYP